MDTTTLSSVTFCCENEKKKLLQIFFVCNYIHLLQQHQ